MGTTNNRLDFIRLALAGLVFLYHVVVLSSVQPAGSMELTLAMIAELAIQGFFIVSGALVYGSYERSRGIADYSSKRFRRLYPAYAVIILIPALIAGAMAMVANEGAAGVLRYVGANLVFANFLEPNLPGLFESNRLSIVNGALWTLKIEVLFYLVLPIIAWGLTRLKQYWWVGIAGLIVAAFAWRDTMLALDLTYSRELSRQLPGQMMYFAAGIALWRMWDRARVHAVVLFLIGGVALALAIFVPALDGLRVLGLTGLIAGIALMPGPQLNVAAWGDISYGVYIVHFPMLQGLVAVGAFATLGIWQGLVLSVILVLAASYMLWWWVEKPALRRDSYYRNVSTKRAPQ